MGNKLETLKLYGITASDGTLTVDADEPITGTLYAVQWIDGSFADGVDAVLSCAGDVTNTILTLTNANDDKLYFPRLLVQDNAGADVAGQYTYPLLSGKPKLAVTSGGDTRNGGCVLYYRRY